MIFVSNKKIEREVDILKASHKKVLFTTGIETTKFRNLKLKLSWQKAAKLTYSFRVCTCTYAVYVPRPFRRKVTKEAFREKRSR